MCRITVVYLCRKVNDPRFSWAFFNSMVTYKSGEEYNFVLALKGFSSNDCDSSFLDFLPDLDCKKKEVVRFDDEKPPTYIFREIAKSVGTRYVIFFTSWTRILASNWLTKYVRVFDTIPSCGIVGATGGYERLNDTTPHPNIGIRSNAFMISRDLFCSLEGGDLTDMWAGNLFEAGPNSMTKQIAKLGLVPVVVDKFGQAWRQEQWPKSCTFRMSQQEGLLIADNRTYQFDVASFRKRRRLALRCWGTDANIVSRPIRLRVVDWLTWNYPRGLYDLIGDVHRVANRLIRNLTGMRSTDASERVFPS